MFFVVTGPHAMPTPAALLSAVYLGCVPLGLSFFLWNRAVAGGNMAIIGFLSYFTPPLAVLLVALVRQQPVSGQVLAGMALILAAKQSRETVCGSRSEKGEQRRVYSTISGLQFHVKSATCAP